MKNQYYKYRPLYTPGSGGGKLVQPFTELIFVKAEIFYGGPADFNDPFDCNLRTHVDSSTDAEWEAYCDEMMAITPASRANLLQVKNGHLHRRPLVEHPATGFFAEPGWQSLPV